MRFVHDGCEIDYEVRGEGRPLLVLHALAGDRRLLLAACEPVLGSAPVRRIHVDLPGHGASRAHLDAASADTLRDALCALARAEHAAGGVLLLGHAYGAYLAQGLLEQLDCAGALLVCPVVEPDLAARTLPPRRVAEREPDLVFEDEHAEQSFDEIAVVQTRAVLDAYHAQVHPGSLQADRGFIDALRARYALARPCRAALAALAGPLDVVCGRDDHWVGFEDAFRLARLAPRASLHVLESCGQLLPIEQPGRFRHLLADWLRRCGVGGIPGAL